MYKKHSSESKSGPILKFSLIIIGLLAFVLVSSFYINYVKQDNEQLVGLEKKTNKDETYSIKQMSNTDVDSVYNIEKMRNEFEINVYDFYHTILEIANEQKVPAGTFISELSNYYIVINEYPELFTYRQFEIIELLELMLLDLEAINGVSNEDTQIHYTNLNIRNDRVGELISSSNDAIADDKENYSLKKIKEEVLDDKYDVKGMQEKFEENVHRYYNDIIRSINEQKKLTENVSSETWDYAVVISKYPESFTYRQYQIIDLISKMLPKLVAMHDSDLDDFKTTFPDMDIDLYDYSERVSELIFDSIDDDTQYESHRETEEQDIIHSVELELPELDDSKITKKININDYESIVNKRTFEQFDYLLLHRPIFNEKDDTLTYYLAYLEEDNDLIIWTDEDYNIVSIEWDSSNYLDETATLYLSTLISSLDSSIDHDEVVDFLLYNADNPRYMNLNGIKIGLVYAEKGFLFRVN